MQNYTKVKRYITPNVTITVNHESDLMNVKG